MRKKLKVLREILELGCHRCGKRERVLCDNCRKEDRIDVILKKLTKLDKQITAILSM